MSWGAFTRTLKLGLLVSFVVFALSACGAGGGQPQQQQEKEEEAAEQRERNPPPQQQEEAKTREVPEYGYLRPGKYLTDEFKPAFSFEVVDEGWVVGGAEERGILDMRLGVEGPVLSFVNEQEVFNPSKLRDMDSAPAPKNLVSWLQRHPYLQTEQSQPATIGGVKSAFQNPDAGMMALGEAGAILAEYCPFEPRVGPL